jgi:hypothetical protein
LKKAFSIFFLTLFLFNVGGYYLVFWALHYHADQELTSIIDAGDYSEGETFEIKIPLSMPYPLHPRGAQRAYGEMEIEGQIYTLVEQRLENDTLHIILMRHLDKENLIETMTDYANLSNDLPGTSQKASSFLGKILKDYTPSSTVTISETTTWSATDIVYRDFVNAVLAGTTDIVSPPPRA